MRKPAKAAGGAAALRCPFFLADTAILLTATATATASRLPSLAGRKRFVIKKGHDMERSSHVMLI
jgi:hypothetical protein